MQHSTGNGKPSGAEKRHKLVDGAFLEPESRMPRPTHWLRTYGSFDEGTLTRSQELLGLPNATCDPALLETSPPATKTSSPLMKKPMQRYYSHTLSQDDKNALTASGNESSRRVWTANDVADYYDSRAELVPRGENYERMIAKINDEARASKQFLDSTKQAHCKSSRLFSGLNSSSESTLSKVNSLQPRNDASHQPKPDKTFDSFLVPHGKGETFPEYRDSDKKNEGSGGVERSGEKPSGPMSKRRMSQLSLFKKKDSQ